MNELFELQLVTATLALEALGAYHLKLDRVCVSWRIIVEANG